MSAPRTWLIRYPDFSFSRPLSEAELLKKISDGEIQVRDEVCDGKGYWFSFQDMNEVRKHFPKISLDGILKKNHEEVTQERYATTASLEVPSPVSPLVSPKIPVAVPAPVPAPVIPPSKLPMPIQTNLNEMEAPKPLWTKVLLAILALAVGILTWFWIG